jgi:hypothetical protein
MSGRPLRVHHPVQKGLPAFTHLVWLQLDDLYGAFLTGIGAWGDAQHAARVSCHNTGHAIDLMTLDRGIHMEIVVWAIANKERYNITRVISNGQVWTAKTGWKPRKYLGRSDHHDHVHLSIDCLG